MRTHHLRVDRTARVLTLGEPASVDEAWLLLHGYGQLAGDMLQACRALESSRRLLVAPEALSRFYLRSGAGPIGASWMTREEREAEIADYVRYLDRVAEWLERDLGCRAPQRVALGFSQGAKTAWRWAALSAARVDGLIAWGGDAPPELDLALARERFRATRLCIVRGSHDPLHTADMLARDRERIARAGLRCEIVEFDGAHHIDAQALERAARALESRPDAP